MHATHRSGSLARDDDTYHGSYCLLWCLVSCISVQLVLVQLYPLYLLLVLSNLDVVLELSKHLQCSGSTNCHCGAAVIVPLTRPRAYWGHPGDKVRNNYVIITIMCLVAALQLHHDSGEKPFSDASVLVGRECACLLLAGEVVGVLSNLCICC